MTPRRPAAPRRRAWPLVLLLAAACAAPQTQPTPSRPTPAVSTSVPPNPEETTAAFLAAWRSKDYPAMYALLSPLSQAATSSEDFTARYQGVADAATLVSLETKILSSLKEGTAAQVSYSVTLHTALVGDITRQTKMFLKYENDRWGVSWADDTILPELAGGNVLVMDYEIPARANIYDRDGHALAAEANAVALGIIPGQITDEPALLAALANLLGRREDTIRALYEYAKPDWYVPVGEANADEVQSRYNYLSGLGGLVMNTIRTRYYTDGGVAPHVVGYVSKIPVEQFEAYKAKGYRGDEKVGVAGLEAWGEQYLAGKRGGRLAVFTPAGQLVEVLAESSAAPAQSIYTTLDRDFQKQVQAALGSMPGAIVALDYNTGEVLAMASNPSYDPNWFDPTNPNSINLNVILNDPYRPLLNRATQGTYPPGSVFKIATLAAALKSGLFAPDTTYTCTGVWDELGPGYVKYDWTVAKELPPHGTINLVEALKFSCNPYFWHIGLALWNADENLLSATARGFGLGEFTRIEQVAEARGLIPDPAWKQANVGEVWTGGDSVNMATGQGYVQTTPLQIASMIAAVANGGTLYRPQVVAYVAASGEPPVYTMQPEVIGSLPVDADQLEVLRQGMRMVTSERGGTAYHRFRGLSIPIAGKTGTSEDPGHVFGLPHSWFAGYTFAGRKDRPDIAVAVIVENIGEGSDYAAPIFRRVIESYFFGRPYSLYPWESEIGVTATPTGSETPTEIATETPVPPLETPTP